MQTAEQIKAARLHAGHTQTQAAALIRSARYQTWSDYESGKQAMPPALFDLYQLLTDQHPDFELRARQNVTGVICDGSNVTADAPRSVK